MVRITIIGWYGTETIGDRAILAGLFRVFEYTFDSFEICLGSIFPVLSERTLVEDSAFFTECAGNKIVSISLFNSLNRRELVNAIANSDLLVIGGGPLMDLKILYMLEYAVDVAIKRRIRTAALGIGWGPLHSLEYVNVVLRIVNKSQLVIFRDYLSLKAYQSYEASPGKVYTSIDPAFFAATFYLETRKDILRKEGCVAINFRDVSLDQYGGDSSVYEKYFCDIIFDVIQRIDKHVFLVPMHTFFIGGDDRAILGRIARTVGIDRVTVIQNPLSLEETMACYYHAKLCIGMRFHSVVLQTVLNGRNYILDYTDPVKGKIVGMLKTLELCDKYKSRYVSLHAREHKFYVEADSERFNVNKEQIDAFMESYVLQLKAIF